MGELLTLDQLAVEGAKRLASDHGFEGARAILVEMIERCPRVRYTVLQLAALKRLAVEAQTTLPASPTPSS